MVIVTGVTFKPPNTPLPVSFSPVGVCENRFFICMSPREQETNFQSTNKELLNQMYPSIPDYAFHVELS